MIANDSEEILTKTFSPSGCLDQPEGREGGRQDTLRQVHYGGLFHLMIFFCDSSLEHEN